MSLIAWYPLNGDTKDYSGNNYHLTNKANLPVSEYGKIGKTYDFNLKKPMIYKGWILPENSTWNDFTITAWIYPTETPVEHGYNVVSFDSNCVIRFRLTTANTIWVLWGGDSSDKNYSGVTGSLKVPLNKWSHVTVRLKDGKITIYINGIKDTESSYGQPIIMLKSTLLIGSYSESSEAEAWRGKLNDIRIYNEALSAKQIKEIAQAKICHYTFNEELYENTTNLYDDKNKLSIANAVIEWEDTHAFKCEIAANIRYAGLYFNSNLTLKPLTTYTLSYKLKKVAGQLLQIRGHVEPTSFEVIHTTINGKKYNNSSYSTGIDITDSFDTYEIIIVFNTKENITSMDKMYIQPNALKDEYVKVRIWDIQVEKKDHATPFTSNKRIHTLKDISGYNHDMTSSLEVSPVWKNDEQKSYVRLAEKAYYYFNDLSIVNLKEFTYSCWIRTSDDQSYNLLGSPTANNSNHSMAIMGGKICFHTYFHTPTKADKNYAVSKTIITDNQWHLATITYDNSVVKTYIDGKLENQSNLTMNFDTYEGNKIGLNLWNMNDMGDYETRRFSGDIKDVRIYATALSAEDIKLLYQPEISIDKTNVIRCSEINEERIKNKKGFNKDASITYNEFNEIPNIESGIYNLKLGNQILPVLIDMDNDEGRWARVFYHNCKSGTVLFSSENSFAEAKETNINAPTTSDKYSILSKLENFRPNTNSSFEFRLKYPTDTNDSNIWKQTSNPTYEKIAGYTPVKINWTSNFWGGLEWTNGSTTLIDGSVNHENWFYAIGASTKYRDGMPSCKEVNANSSTPNDVELWVRINNYDLFADNLIKNVSISRDGILTAKEFREI